MKTPKNIALLLVTLMFLSVFGTLNQGTVFKNKNNFVILVLNYNDSIDYSNLINEKIDIVSFYEKELVVYVTGEQYDLLLNQGFEIKKTFDSFSEFEGWDKNPEILRSFHNHDQLTIDLQQIADNYPNISMLCNLGQSVQGREIWALKISDNVSEEEIEPEVRICGCHHGNEIMSVELPLLLAKHLVENYSIDPEITDLVDTFELWIIPMVNPDGRQVTSRYNANGVDLNRDYGYMWEGSSGSTSPFSQPETQIIRQNALENNFVVSLSYHTTAAYVNYVWNYKGQETADHAFISSICEDYADLTGYTPVLGFDWYQVRGDTDDFSYGCRGDFDTTIETANSNIPAVWNLNRDAMINYIKAANIGLTGVVTDINTGDPINATIIVEEANWPCFTDPYLGDYHKPLFPGNYHVKVRANGYGEEEFVVEVIDSEQPTILNVQLTPNEQYFANQIVWVNFFDPYGYPNNFNNNPTEAVWALAPPDGLCASLGKGGSILLDMGFEIQDEQDSTDFIIYEGDGEQDGYLVYGSNDWNQGFELIGTGIGTTEFDISVIDAQEIQYIKIVDDNDGSAYDTNPGADIDAVQILSNPLPPNNSPYGPTAPSGLNIAYVGYEYSFKTNTTDPEGHQLFYKWSFSDQWDGPYNSGENVFKKHIWDQMGTYQIQVKAKDDPNWDGNHSDGLESSWSDNVSITVRKAGDVNGDSKINIVDLIILFLNLREIDSIYDINNDGIVNYKDLLILFSNWNS